MFTLISIEAKADNSADDEARRLATTLSMSLHKTERQVSIFVRHGFSKILYATGPQPAKNVTLPIRLVS